MILKNPKYQIIVEVGIVKRLNAILSTLYTKEKVHIITDKNLYKLYQDTLVKQLPDYQVFFTVVEPGESSKTINCYKQVITELINQGIKRDGLIIAFGGGVVGDLAGFVAATIYRGVLYIQVPTSLLAMVDSSIGGKTGLNLDVGKNLVGAFYYPKAVLIDPMLLNTLPRIEYNNGLAEVIKAGLLADMGIIEYLRDNDTLDITHLIKAIRVKLDIVNQDEFESNQRMLLNFGHTFGHAIEKHYDFKIFKHGQAISYGMLYAIELGINKSITNPNLYEEVLKLLLKFDLVKLPIMKKDLFLESIKLDKKNLSDSLRFIYLADYQKPIIMKVKDFDL